MKITVSCRRSPFKALHYGPNSRAIFSIIMLYGGITSGLNDVPSSNSYVEAVSLTVSVFEDRVYKEVINVN